MYLSDKIQIVFSFSCLLSFDIPNKRCLYRKRDAGTAKNCGGYKPCAHFRMFSVLWHRVDWYKAVTVWDVAV
jgi:hypothetical protein